MAFNLKLYVGVMYRQFAVAFRDLDSYIK